MKEILAIIRPNKVNETRDALNEIGITSYTATGRVLGRGKGKVDYRIIHGAEDGYEEAVTQLGDSPKLVPKRLINIVVSDSWVEKTVQSIIETNKTGNHGDGKIFVLPIKKAIRVRTAEIAEGAEGEGVLDSGGAL